MGFTVCKGNCGKCVFVAKINHYIGMDHLLTIHWLMFSDGNVLDKLV